MDRGIYADRVRMHALRQYIEPAHRRHDSTVRIVAGDVQKAVRLSNRISLVCNALKSRKFLEGNRLTLEKCGGSAVWDEYNSGVHLSVRPRCQR
jgi:hypothetical protein